MEQETARLCNVLGQSAILLLPGLLNRRKDRGNRKRIGLALRTGQKRRQVKSAKGSSEEKKDRSGTSDFAIDAGYVDSVS